MATSAAAVMLVMPMIGLALRRFIIQRVRWKKHSEQRPVVTSRAQLMANQDRVVGEFEALAERLRGRLTTRRDAVQRLLHDTNQ
jgi:hypothetical protein